MSDDFLVYAFQPRAVDPPQHVADGLTELRALEGFMLAAEQCDRCGNSRYVVTASDRPRVLFDAVCSDYPGDEVSASFGGCGAAYPIRPWAEREVCF